MKMKWKNNSIISWAYSSRNSNATNMMFIKIVPETDIEIYLIGIKESGDLLQRTVSARKEMAPWSDTHNSLYIFSNAIILTVILIWW